MKNIAILVNTLKTGGAEKQSIILLNVLMKHYNTTLIVFHGDLIDDKIFNLISNDKHTVIKLTGNIFSKLYSLLRTLKENQIGYLFSYLTKQNLLAGFLGRLVGVEFVYGGIRSTKFPIWKLYIEKFVMNFLTDKTIFNSYSGENLFSPNKAEKSIVIPNCVPLISDGKCRLYREKMKIISVGRFDKSKDYRTAILAANSLKQLTNNFVLQIVGYGNLEDEIRRWISEFDLNDFVELNINPGNLPELLDDSDIYLSTSIFEGTSNSIMEAMNASLPIVATSVGDNGRLIQLGKNGYLNEVGDFNGIARNLYCLLENLDLRNDFGLMSNKILRDNYSLDRFREEYTKLIEQP